MAAFLRMLSATHSVSAAARSVGMSRQSAYRLRSRLKGKPFDLAWDVAFHHSYDNLAHAALDRALNGVEVPVYHFGEIVGTRKVYNDYLLMFLLRNRAPKRFGADNARGMSAVDRQYVAKLKKQWHKEWERAEAQRHDLGELGRPWTTLRLGPILRKLAGVRDINGADGADADDHVVDREFAHAEGG